MSWKFIVGLFSMYSFRIVSQAAWLLMKVGVWVTASYSHTSLSTWPEIPIYSSLWFMFKSAQTLLFQEAKTRFLLRWDCSTWLLLGPGPQRGTRGTGRTFCSAKSSSAFCPRCIGPKTKTRNSRNSSSAKSSSAFCPSRYRAKNQNAELAELYFKSL